VRVDGAACMRLRPSAHLHRPWCATGRLSRGPARRPAVRTCRDQRSFLIRGSRCLGGRRFPESFAELKRFTSPGETSRSQPQHSGTRGWLGRKAIICGRVYHHYQLCSSCSFQWSRHIDAQGCFGGLFVFASREHDLASARKIIDASWEIIDREAKKAIASLPGTGPDQ
jgi:hypothetical protein